MRLNQFIAQHTSYSRRSADDLIKDGRIEVNGELGRVGDTVIESDRVTLDGHPLDDHPKHTTIMLNKPGGYVVSRNGQGSKTVYDLLPRDLWHLQPVGRLDKNSSGLLLMTNDGELSFRLTHPKHQKEKIYSVTLDKELSPIDQDHISHKGVQLDDGVSKLKLTLMRRDGKVWEVRMHEGRNRQIRRTFAALDYKVIGLHRTNFGQYELKDLKSGDYSAII